MVYFYTVKALGEEIYATGGIKRDSKIVTLKDLGDELNYIKRETAKEWNKKYPDLEMTEDDVVVIAFNPL